MPVEAGFCHQHTDLLFGHHSSAGELERIILKTWESSIKIGDLRHGFLIDISPRRAQPLQGPLKARTGMLSPKKKGGDSCCAKYNDGRTIIRQSPNQTDLTRFAVLSGQIKIEAKTTASLASPT